MNNYKEKIAKFQKNIIKNITYGWTFHFSEKKITIMLVNKEMIQSLRDSKKENERCNVNININDEDIG